MEDDGDRRLRGGEREEVLDRPLLDPVLDLDDQEMETPPATLDPAFQDLIRGVYKLDGRLLLMLDPIKAIDLTTAETA